jgi:hypothetical protein
MLVLTLIMLAIVAMAALVVTFVAYPHRGQEVPNAAWLGDAMARAAEAAPTLPTEGDEPADDRGRLALHGGLPGAVSGRTS